MRTREKDPHVPPHARELTEFGRVGCPREVRCFATPSISFPNGSATSPTWTSCVVCVCSSPPSVVWCLLWRHDRQQQARPHTTHHTMTAYIPCCGWQLPEGYHYIWREAPETHLVWSPSRRCGRGGWKCEGGSHGAPWRAVAVRHCGIMGKSWAILTGHATFVGGVWGVDG